MAIEFVGGAVAGKAGATSGTTTIALNSGLTGGIASAVSADDLVIAVFGTGSTADRTLAITDGTTNYTLIGTELYSNDTFDTNLRVAYKFMGGTPDTATTFGPTGHAQDSGAMAVYVFRGVDSTTPIDVTTVTATGINTSRADPPSVTPSTAGAFPVHVGAAAHNGGVDTFTSGDLTDFRTRGGSNDTNDVTIGIGHIDNWTSGASNPAAFGHSQTDSTSFSWAALSLVLRPTADTTDDLLANDVQSTSEVSAPAVGQTHVLNASDVQSTSNVTAPVLGQVHALLADDVESASEVSTPSVGQIHALVSVSVESASEVLAPAIGQTHVILADDVQSTSNVTAPAVGQEHSLLASDVESASEVTAPQIYQTGMASYAGPQHPFSIRRLRSRRLLQPPRLEFAQGVDTVDDLLADDIESASEVSAPVLGQVHGLLANDLESASEVTAPSFGQAHALLANSVQSTSEVGSPAVGQDHALLANDVESASEVSSPAVGQEHALLANDVESASEVSAPVLTDIGGGTDALLAEDVESASEVSSPVLTEVVANTGSNSPHRDDDDYLRRRIKIVTVGVNRDDEDMVEIIRLFLERINAESRL